MNHDNTAPLERLNSAIRTELVISDTCCQHPWLQRILLATRGYSERDYYVWSDDLNKYASVGLTVRILTPPTGNRTRSP